MYLVISNNEFLEENIMKLFLQKGIEVSNDRNSKFYESINLSLKESILKIFIGDEFKFSITLPTNFESIFNKINDFLSLIFIKYENVKYFPLNQKIVLDNKVIKLGIIHNTIISMCLLYLKDGVNKFSLYEKLWPEDKDIYMNKLDTHLTNLKNKIGQGLLKEIKFLTKNNNLYLVSN